MVACRVKALQIERVAGSIPPARLLSPLRVNLVLDDMPKRSHSPEHSPPAKRLHTSEIFRPHSFSLFNFDNSLYDELMLSIFSHLSWIDLCVTQPTSKNWARLAGDNELWKIQYLQEYGRTRLRGSKGFIVRLDGREVKPLPGRAKSDQFKDWKWMFRISSNWRRGVSASLKYNY